MLTWTRGHANRSPSPDSPTLAPGTALDMLYDAKLGNFSLKPQLTYWVDGQACRKLRPDCRVLRVEGIVEVGNRTYLAFFDFQNKTLNLVPANETAVKEYLEFFREHGGKVFSHISKVKSIIKTSFGENVSVRELNTTGVIPAIVKVEKG
ncbi:hypothetical protein [Thermococcus sp.]